MNKFAIQRRSRIIESIDLLPQEPGNGAGLDMGAVGRYEGEST
ncbi:hypothetical protein [Paenibacillus sp. PL2-23]